jgi:PAS domain S-box-containing protein
MFAITILLLDKTKCMATTEDDIHILHLDDEPELAELTAEFLQRQDGRINIDTATTATEALERVTEKQFDCIISDYDMPGQNGIEFLKTVREKYPSLPFILYTGKGSEEVASDAIAAGATDYIQKEAGTEQYELLANRIQNAVEQSNSKRAQQRAEQYFQAAGNIMLVLNTDGTVARINERGCDLLGYECSELIGSDWFNLVPETIEGEVTDVVSSFWDKDASPIQTTVNAIETKTGEQVVIKWHNTALQNKEGNTIGILSSGVDITERKQREEKIQELKNRFELAVKGGKLGVWDWDMQTDHVEFNREWAAMLGHSLDEIEPHLQAWKSRIHPDDIDAAEAALNEHIVGKTDFYTAEHRMKTADGDWKWIRDVGKIFERNQNDDPVRAVGIHIDINEQKSYEQSLEQERDRLDQFAGIVSHDLRNPLNVAQGGISLAQQECDSEHLDAATKAVDRSFELIEDMLDFARAGQAIRETEPVAIHDCANECWDMVETADADIKVDVESIIQADRMRLRQLLENLFCNAVEYGHKDVAVRIGSLPGGFYVEDDGPGIPQDERQEVWESGYSGCKNETGFGLSIVKEIVTAHDWEIRITEGSDGGARFEITGVEIIDE